MTNGFQKTGKKIAILGASRGLGKAMFERFQSLEPQNSYFLCSRKEALLKNMKSENSFLFVQDFTQNLEPLWTALKEFDPTHIIFCAGAGVYGEFPKKDIKDHFWTLKLNLLFPMELAHFSVNHLNIEQIAFVGSSIAEDKPDPLASSYAAAKHGLKGFVTSFQKEKPSIDVRLVSPPYMDTEMLPLNAWPRKEGLAQNPQKIAQKIIDTLLDKAQKNTHLYISNDTSEIL